MERKVTIQSFEVVLEPEEEGGYHVYAPSLKGCHSYGDTREEALKNIADAIEGCLAALKKHGHKIPEREKVQVEVEETT
ncbi:MAG: type II toxin-antitoxin system HicB family antitoxin [Dehalococcoidia bacterium]